MKQIKLIIQIEARQYCVWRTIIVSSTPNLRLLYSFMDKVFFSTRKSPSIQRQLAKGSFRFCFCFIQLCFGAKRFIFSGVSEAAINRNNCPKSLRKLFVLIIIILCDNRFILLFCSKKMLASIYFAAPNAIKSGNSRQKTQKSVMMGRMGETWDINLS